MAKKWEEKRFQRVSFRTLTRRVGAGARRWEGLPMQTYARAKIGVRKP